MAIATVIASSKALRVRILSGVISSHTMSTMRRPALLLMRWWPESGAGIDDAPGRHRPSVSAMAVMVEAVPMVMQCP